MKTKTIQLCFFLFATSWLPTFALIGEPLCQENNIIETPYNGKESSESSLLEGRNDVYDSFGGWQVELGEQQEVKSTFQRHFLQNNAFGLPKGTGYYQNAILVFNQVHYGLTDFFSVGAGFVPWAIGGDHHLFMLASTIAIPVVKDAFSLGLNTLVAIPFDSTRKTGVLFNLLGTYGNKDANLSIGLGYGYDEFGRALKVPLFSFSGMLRTGKKHHLLFEAYSKSPILNIEEKGIFAWAGGRFDFGAVSLDYGAFLIPQNDFIFPILPWLSLTVPFGKK